MAVRLTTVPTALHKKTTEAGANTWTSERVEIPNSANAKAVRCDRIVLDLPLPETVADTLTSISVEVALGDQKAAVDAVAGIDASVPGVVALTANYNNDGQLTVGQREFSPHRRVPRSADGKYYVTIALKGSNNVNPKIINLTADFSMI